MAARLPVKPALRAAAEIRRASAWWRANREAAPLAFAEDLARAYQVNADAGRVEVLALWHARRGREPAL